MTRLSKKINLSAKIAEVDEMIDYYGPKNYPKSDTYCEAVSGSFFEFEVGEFLKVNNPQNEEIKKLVEKRAKVTCAARKLDYFFDKQSFFLPGTAFVSVPASCAIGASVGGIFGLPIQFVACGLGATAVYSAFVGTGVLKVKLLQKKAIKCDAKIRKLTNNPKIKSKTIYDFELLEQY